MKKHIITILLVAASLCTHAQVDTIWGRRADYWYPHWYDQCISYYEDPGWVFGSVPVYFSMDKIEFQPENLLLEKVSVNSSFRVRGVAVLVSVAPQSIPSLSSERAEEWVLVHSVDTAGLLADTLALARWDTANVRTMLLPQNHDCELSGNLTSSMRALVYEAIFDSAIVLEGDYILAGTFNSNQLVSNGQYSLYKNKTTAYAVVNDDGNPCDDCYPDEGLVNYTSAEDYISLSGWRCFGPFLLIPDDGLTLTVLTSDSLMGTVTGSGTYRSGVPVVVSATAAPYCRFSSWSDGSTDNPRVMYLHSDSTITALFTRDSSNLVRVLPNNPDWGTASGTGIYPYWQSVTISATAADGYLFSEWADGNRDNPRTVMPVSDTVFTAIFDPIPVGIEAADDISNITILPNPTRGIVDIRCAEGSHSLAVFDAAGRLMLKQAFSGTTTAVDISALPEGIYTFIVHTDECKKIAKTIIKL